MTDSKYGWRTPAIVLACGSLILTLAMGVRQSFGLFLPPMTLEYGWGRETFAFAMALSNLLWGVFQPFFGAAADRHGAARVVVVSALLYVAGLALMPHSASGITLNFSAGLIIGLALSGTTFGVILGVIGRAYPPERRSFALGVATAGGSFGQFLMLPLTQWLISAYGWKGALYALAATMLVIVPLSAAMVETGREAVQGPRQSLREALREASSQSSFWYLTSGFFVCGFQVAFIAVHLPAYLADSGMAAHVGALALALIGLFNIAGSFLAGILGGHYSKKYLLSAIYFARAAVIAVFLLWPISAGSVYLFAAAIGFLWLGTVPLTNGLIAQIFGVRYLATLFGIVFLSHQLGSFLGVWLGGVLFDMTGTYQLVWVGGIALGVVAGLLNLPIDERTLPRPQPA
ncbi:MAG TPA: MFS transporter [Burkholderiales bacterium]|jgi:MFS family permease|nr:MFS transporter [Burkholderiales bacterium]